ncbi:hypothetical protein ACLOJK_023994, partial [Asimina triloba]
DGCWTVIVIRRLLTGRGADGIGDEAAIAVRLRGVDARWVFAMIWGGPPDDARSGQMGAYYWRAAALDAVWDACSVMIATVAGPLLRSVRAD